MVDADTPRARGLWWKVPLALLALFAVVTIIGHRIWTSRERADVARRVAAIRALGEPTDVADLAEPTVPDAVNAAIALRAAAAAYADPPSRKDRRRAIEDDDPHAFESPLTDDEASLLRATIADNATALAALDDAARRPRVAWGDASPGTPALVRLLPHLTNERRLADLLNDAALLAAHDHADAAEVLAPLATIDAIARPVNARRSLVGSLVAIGMEGMSASTTIAVAPRLSLETRAGRDAVGERIASMLGDASIEQMFRAGLLGERVDLRAAIASVRDGTLGPSGLVGTTPASTTPAPTTAQRVGAYVLRPIFYRDEAALLDYLAAALATADATNLADWHARSTVMLQVDRDILASRVSILSRILMPSLDRAFQAKYRLVTERHLAAVALAARWYASDHAGASPPALNALVPTYLPAVPSDAIDGKPLRYDASRAIAWSVGDNGSDDQGDETTRSPREAGNRWSMQDAVIHLAPTTRPATQPGES